VAKVQKVSTKEFKEEAVKLAQSSGKPGAMSQTRRDHFKSFRFPRSETLQNWSKVSSHPGKSRGLVLE